MGRTTLLPDFTAADGPGRGIDEVLLGFARMLQVAGVAVTPDRTQSMLQAVHLLDVLDQDQVYWAGRFTLCSNPEDLPKYDAGFAVYFEGKKAPEPSGTVAAKPRAVQMPMSIDAPGSTETEGDPDDPVPGRATADEVLRHKDFAELSDADRRALKQLFAQLAPIVATRRSRRFGQHHRGLTDPRRSIRGAMRTGGELTELKWRTPRVRPRRLVIIADISGSMAPYTDPILRFAHAAMQRNRGHCEVFTFGTRLTRVTRELLQRDPERALRAAGEAIPDWSGGTRIGEMLQAFLDRWGQRGTARQAIVVVFSDGWERGDPTLLGEQMKRLHRLAHRVIWANPHKGYEGYEPLTGGIVASLPSIDEFVAGHSFDSYQQLGRLISHA